MPCIPCRKLFTVITFMVVFLTVIFMQREIEKSFAVEDSLLASLQRTLPALGEGYLNSDPAGTGALSSSEDWYEWMQSTFDALYTDAVRISNSRM